MSICRETSPLPCQLAMLWRSPGVLHMMYLQVHRVHATIWCTSTRVSTPVCRPEYQLQCATKSINSSVPPRVSTPVCHQEYQLQCATKSINSSVPPRVSTPVCQQEYQLQCATKSINSRVSAEGQKKRTAFIFTNSSTDNSLTVHTRC